MINRMLSIWHKCGVKEENPQQRKEPLRDFLNYPNQLARIPQVGQEKTKTQLFNSDRGAI